eukprot:jgi/Mesvir1/23527/Mv25734-RA.1
MTGRCRAASNGARAAKPAKMAALGAPLASSSTSARASRADRYSWRHQFRGDMSSQNFTGTRPVWPQGCRWLHWSGPYINIGAVAEIACRRVVMAPKCMASLLHAKGDLPRGKCSSAALSSHASALATIRFRGHLSAGKVPPGFWGKFSKRCMRNLDTKISFFVRTVQPIILRPDQIVIWSLNTKISARWGGAYGAWPAVGAPVAAPHAGGR